MGVLQTLLLGILASAVVAVFFEFRKRRSDRYRISVFYKSSQLYVQKNAGDVGIKVNYLGKNIKTALVVLHVGLENKGRKDIMFSSHFTTKIRIHCEGYRLISVKTSDSKCRPEIELSSDDDALLSWDILKKNEKIDLELVAELKEDTNGVIDSLLCYNNLSFDFRSDCLDSIVLEEAYSEEENRERHNEIKLIYRSILLLSLTLLMMELDMVTATRFNINLNNGQPLQETNIMYNSVFDKYIVSSKSDGTMIVSSEELCGTKAIILNDKQSKYYHFSFVFQLLCLLLLFISLLMVCITVIKTIHRRRNRKALRDPM